MEDIYEENCYSITIARSLKKKSNLLIVFLSVLPRVHFPKDTSLVKIADVL